MAGDNNRFSLTWLGTAGFIFRKGETCFATDPFLSRKDPDNPPQINTGDFKDVARIFVGHGHFDHVWDIPEIARLHSHITICGASNILNRLRKKGVPAGRLIPAESGDLISIEDVKVRSFASRHVCFDRKLVAGTLARCGISGSVELIKMVIAYPQGNVRSFLFTIGERSVLFLSSGGSTAEELQIYKQLKPDILLLPVQGNSDILDIAANIGSVAQPRMIIPHHHDNFYPPISQKIDISSLPDRLRKKGYTGEYLELEMFRDTMV